MFPGGAGPGGGGTATGRAPWKLQPIGCRWKLQQNGRGVSKTVLRVGTLRLRRVGARNCMCPECEQFRPDVVNPELATSLLTPGTCSVAVKSFRYEMPVLAPVLLQLSAQLTGAWRLSYRGLSPSGCSQIRPTGCACPSVRRSRRTSDRLPPRRAGSPPSRSASDDCASARGPPRGALRGPMRSG